VTRILLIDDEPIVGAGLRAIFEAQWDLQVVGEERDVHVAAAKLARSQPDVILLDVHAAGAVKFGAIRILVEGRPRAAVVLVSGDEDPATMLRAIAAGASGYLPSRAPTELMVQVVRTVAAGGLVLPRPVGADMARQLASELDERAAVVGLLSERERGVLKLLAGGRSNTEIGRELFISEATVKKHVSQILRKLRRRDRLQAALYACELGLGPRRSTVA